MSNPQRIKILNTAIDNLSMQETLALVQEKIQTGEQVHHVVVNAGKVVAMQKDAELRHSVNQCHIINADGQSVVWASRFLGKPLKERVAGIDLMESLVEMAHKNNNKIFLFGAKEEVVKNVVDKYSEIYSP
ncbi:WecB/TagA/CpsF family glycosyltransferase, partial [Leeuwenhoekiella sp.]|uniref:WecB/TagA/CpsF family glycosyltransferase n=1 Tax=Leeuwenhoekiella sp. TaxID=1977054 RepID=UPI0025BE7005